MVVAFPTAEQEITARGLVEMHGSPDQIMLERTEEPYGQLRLIWWKPQRCLCIKPDGKRQLYDGVRRSFMEVARGN